MQDIETYKKVQEKFENSLNKYAHILSKPYFKTFKDSLKAMLMSSTPIVRKIAQELPGRASVKKKQERITYHLDNKEAYNKLKDAYHMIESSKITNDSLIVIDESDITKPCSQKQENISKVRDGSTGEYKNGYYSFNATIVSQESIGSVSLSPLYSYIYSNKAEDESKNDRLSNFILDTTIYSNNKGIYVFDRGYDDRKLINQLCDQNNNFTMRSTGIRDLIVNNIKTSFKETVRNVKLKHEYFCSFKNRLFSYNAIKVNIITDPYPTKNPNTCEVWLVIARYGKRGGFFYFFANFNKGIESAKIIGQMVLEIYSKRWKIEEYFRQFKQDLHIEKIQLLKYNRIQAMNLWMTILNNFIYSCKKIIIKADLPFKNYLMDFKNDNTIINGFAYYRIYNLVKRIFINTNRRKTKEYKKRMVNDDIQITIESYALENFGVC